MLRERDRLARECGDKWQSNGSSFMSVQALSRVSTHAQFPVLLLLAAKEKINAVMYSIADKKGAGSIVNRYKVGVW